MVNFRKSQVFIGKLTQSFHGGVHGNGASPYFLEKFSRFTFVHIVKITAIIAQRGKAYPGFCKQCRIRRLCLLAPP